MIHKHEVIQSEGGWAAGGSGTFQGSGSVTCTSSKGVVQVEQGIIAILKVAFLPLECSEKNCKLWVGGDRM